jgi:hypothetical protein
MCLETRKYGNVGLKTSAQELREKLSSVPAVVCRGVNPVFGPVRKLQDCSKFACSLLCSLSLRFTMIPAYHPGRWAKETQASSTG